MKNPFLDFKLVPFERRELPLDRIVKAKNETMERLIDGFLRLMDEEAKDLVWLVEHSRVVKAYNAATKSVQDLRYDQDDIEEFCNELDSSKRIPYMISGPAGIYISALINSSREERISLRLHDFQRSFHFLGYRLPDGKALILQGDVGNFTGAGLAGGDLMVEGSTGNWCGAGMFKGKIHVKGHSGQKTGEWMRGGQIHVDGQIWSTGQTRLGGEIYMGGKLIMD